MPADARGRNLLSRLRRGRFSSVDQMRAVNFSYVLHDRSTSRVIRAAVHAAREHTERAFTTQEPVVDGTASMDVDRWLAPSIGLPDDLLDALTFAGVLDAPITVIDGGDVPTIEVPFFRAMASLTLPDDSPRTVGIAALVVRPGTRVSQLILRGPFNWPDEKQDALRTLESIIQAHVQQWTPDRQLWQGPIEDTLPAEVR